MYIDAFQIFPNQIFVVEGFSHFICRDVMWNNISGSIPKEMGNLKSLVTL